MIMKSALMKMLVVKGLKFGLNRLRGLMSTEDFKTTVDEVLDRVEDHFTQDSTADIAVELITAELRYYFKIPDKE